MAAKLPESAHSALLKAVVLSPGQRNNKAEEELSKALGISVSDSTSAVAALGMLSAFVSMRTELPEQVLQQMVDSGLVSTSDTPSLLRVVSKTSQIKEEFGKATETRSLVNAVLPSFDDFEAVLDIRIGDLKRGGFAQPIAIAFLDTDARDHRLWFQLTREDLENLLEKLNALLGRFKEAEELKAKWPPITGGP